MSRWMTDWHDCALATWTQNKSVLLLYNPPGALKTLCVRESVNTNFISHRRHQSCDDNIRLIAKECHLKTGFKLRFFIQIFFLVIIFRLTDPSRWNVCLR